MSDRRVMTPKNCPAGTRGLFGSYAGTYVYEATVLEWSPSGEYVNVKYTNDNTHWIEPAWLIENLARIAAALEGRK